MKPEAVDDPLHSTMFLLIQGTGKVCAAAAPYFTFHNVSINTA